MMNDNQSGVEIMELKRELKELESQFGQFCAITEALQRKITEQEQNNQVLVRSNKQLIQWMDDIIRERNHYMDNAVYEILDPRNEELTIQPKIAPIEETIEKIVDDRFSVCRFGDGEFSTMEGISRHGFQTIHNDKLSKRLKEVLQSNDEHVLIAIADNYGSLDSYTEQTRREIRAYMTRKVRASHYKILDFNRVYGNAYLTRPYMMYDDKEINGAATRFAALRQIWDQRHCIIVEGDKTRMGIGNDLFDNAASIKRIIGSAKNAFECYDEIRENCMAQSEDALYLIALGPTATVLAYDLAMSGRQALDIGHIDLEYEWYLRRIEHREIVNGKYTNECPGGDVVSDCESQVYQSQIIAQCV